MSAAPEDDPREGEIDRDDYETWESKKMSASPSSPKRIYIQQPRDADEKTWREDRINDSDAAYDIVDPARPALIRSGDEMLARFMANMLPAKLNRSRRTRTYSRSHYVIELFAVGSTAAHQMCRWLGYDPDEKVILRPMHRD